MSEVTFHSSVCHNIILGWPSIRGEQHNDYISYFFIFYLLTNNTVGGTVNGEKSNSGGCARKEVHAEPITLST